MLITETVSIEGSEFVHNYSDANFYIQKIGTEEIYSDAYDPIQFKDERKYVETDKKIEDKEGLIEDDSEIQKN